MTRTEALDIESGREAGGAAAGCSARELSHLDAARVHGVLQTTPQGLSDAEAQSRARVFGSNHLQEVPGPSLAQQVLSQFVHLFALLLWVGSGLAFLTGQPQLGVAIAVVILVNGAFGVWQEHRADRAVAALRRLLPDTVSVLRDGDEVRLSAEALVPGDVLLLSEGDRLSADARLVEADDLRLDESALTGETHPAHKTANPWRDDAHPVLQAPNLAFTGSTVLGGSGRAVVYSTGMRTEFGRIAQLTQSVPDEPSPLQVEVARIARRVALLSLLMGVGFFALGYWFAGLSLRDGAIFAVGIVLGNVPEGLLPTMTLALAMGVQRMARHNAIVKRLSAVETLGCCTVICSDKTGTLTENQMTVREVWTPSGRATVTGAGYEPHGEFIVDGQAVPPGARVPFLPLLRIGCLCNGARLQPPTEGQPGWQVRGDPTEGCLLVLAAKTGVDAAAELRQRPLVRRLAFDPRRKRMSTIHRALAPEGHLVAYVKGAPRALLDHCTHVLVEGREVELTVARREEALAEHDRLARAGLRVLAMAYRYLPPEAEAALATLDPGAVEQDLVFAGLVAMHDPPREEVPEAVAKCRAAGIRVVMVTGDEGLTAAAIARQIGIRADETDPVVDGAALDQLTDAALADLLMIGQPIFARVTPEQKLRIVAALQALGETVAVTGDGVNDAPALKKADIGVAMGISGTDVAREAADMVLVDDNFATIVAAVEEGRAIFDNMRKFIVYIFAHLAPEAIPFVFFALFRTPLPLTVMQILAIDLGTETLPALALGVERAEPDVMRRPPRPRGQPLLDLASLTRGYAFLGGMSALVALGAFFLLLTSQGWTWGETTAPTAWVGAQATTVVFLAIVILQVGNIFACRTERTSAFTLGLFSNHFLLWGIAFELVFAAALIYLPVLQPVFGTAALDPIWWLLLGACAPLVFLADELHKLYLRRRATSEASSPARGPVH